MRQCKPFGDKVVCAIPASRTAGAFGDTRKHDVHTGIDLYCKEDTEVFAVRGGVVVNIVWFTGRYTDPPSDWWNDTQAVLIESEDGEGVFCYGEILPSDRLQVGSHVTEGEVIGRVKTVLRKNKGRPMTMLHFEMYKKGTTEPVWWKLGEPQPDVLLDPTEFLKSLDIPMVTDIMDMGERRAGKHRYWVWCTYGPLTPSDDLDSLQKSYGPLAVRTTLDVINATRRES